MLRGSGEAGEGSVTLKQGLKGMNRGKAGGEALITDLMKDAGGYMLGTPTQI